MSYATAKTYRRHQTNMLPLPPNLDHLASSSIPTVEADLANALRGAGWDAFVSSDPSTMRGGVSVHVTTQDPRLQWTSLNRKDRAPVGHFFTQNGSTFILHAGRVTDLDDVQRVRAFVAALLARSSEHPGQPIAA